MNRIIKVIINRLAPRPSPPLGRWRLDYCSNKVEHKVNLTNEDHCGPCSYYRLSKVSSDTKTNSKTITTSDEDYKFLCM